MMLPRRTMDNQDDNSPAPPTTSGVRLNIAGRRAQAGARKPGWLRRLPLLWQMVLIALVGHVAFIGLTSSDRLFGGGGGAETLEQIYGRGEAAMAQGDYLAAMEQFQRVLDAQPKPPPVFAKAADRHRLADRLAKQKKVPAGGRDAATKPSASTRPSGDEPGNEKEPPSEETNAKPAPRVRQPAPDDED